MDLALHSPIQAVLIEDDPQDTRRVREMLATQDRGGIEIKSAGGLAEGISLLADGTTDVVLLDLQLPDCQGLKTLVEVRIQAPSVPVVVLTGLDNEVLAAQATLEGANDFLVKDRLDSDLLVRSVRLAVERRQAERRIEHLGAVLQAIRGINQLITHETDRDRFLARACTLLIEHGGFGSVWIGLLDDSGRFEPTAHAGATSRFDALIERCAKSMPPVCAQRALAEPGVVVKVRGTTLCGGCPLHKDNAGTDELCTRIERNGTVYGTLAATMPAGIRPDAEQQALFADVAADLAYALDTMDKAREHRVLEWQLAQAQKLEAIGRLTAGIAHEINTPVQYVGDNVRFLTEAFRDLGEVLDAYRLLVEAAKAGTITRELTEHVEAACREADTDFLRTEIPGALRHSSDGIERVADIVRAMRDFSRPGIVEKAPASLNRAIEATAIVTRNKWKYVAEMAIDLAPALPEVRCQLGQFNQVILNLILNAARAIGEAIGDTTGGAPKGRITVTTRRTGDWAEIRVGDTGAGIPEAAGARLFDPLFAPTEPEAEEIGDHGLAYCHDVIVHGHGGTMTYETGQGAGTTFIIRLPLEPAGVLTATAKQPG